MMPVVLFLLGTFGITWIFHGLIVYLGIRLDNTLSAWLFNVGQAGPLLAAVAVTLWFHGRQGVWDLLLSGAKWRFGLQWYLAAAFLMVFFYLGSIGLYMLAGGSAPGPLFKVSWLGLLWILVQQVQTQIFEEYGWRGFLQPLLNQHLGSLVAAVAVAVIWAAWHLPLFYISGSHQSGSFWSFCMWLICWSVIMAALYHQTGGSTLSAMIFHMSLNACFFAINVPDGAEPYMLALEVAGALAAIPFLPRPLFWPGT